MCANAAFISFLSSKREIRGASMCCDSVRLAVPVGESLR